MQLLIRPRSLVFVGLLLSQSCNEQHPETPVAPGTVVAPAAKETNVAKGEPGATTTPQVAPAAPTAPAEQGEPRLLPFEITKVYPNQSVTDVSPWHAPKGDWIFLEAKTAGGSTFIVGLPPRTRRTPKELGFGDAVIATADRPGARAFVEELAKAFGVPAPSAAPEKAVHALRVSTAVRTENAMRDSTGGFGGVGGGWTATRWTLGGEANPSEVYFNYNLGSKQGEFAERNRDDDVGVVTAIAHALRDGE